MAEQKLIKMQRESDGLLADVHPAEVANYSQSGFVEISDNTKTEKPLSKMNKAELVAKAESFGIDVTPDSMTNAQIIEAIEAHN